MAGSANSSVWVPKKLLKRLHDRAGYKPLHVQIAELLETDAVLREIERRDPDLVAKVRQAAVS